MRLAGETCMPLRARCWWYSPVKMRPSPPDSAEVIVNGVSSQRRGVMYLEDVPHVCTISREHAHIAQALEELFRKAETEKTA